MVAPGSTPSAALEVEGPSPKKKMMSAYMYVNECPCGIVFKDRVTLDKHIQGDHIQSGVWSAADALQITTPGPPCSNTSGTNITRTDYTIGVR